MTLRRLPLVEKVAHHRATDHDARAAAQRLNQARAARCLTGAGLQKRGMGCGHKTLLSRK